jgi:hypothetical protein
MGDPRHEEEEPDPAVLDNVPEAVQPVVAGPGQPSSRAVDTTTKGERSMNARAWASMRSMSFLAASAVGGP